MERDFNLPRTGRDVSAEEVEPGGLCRPSLWKFGFPSPYIWWWKSQFAAHGPAGGSAKCALVTGDAVTVTQAVSYGL